MSFEIKIPLEEVNNFSNIFHTQVGLYETSAKSAIGHRTGIVIEAADELSISVLSLGEEIQHSPLPFSEGDGKGKFTFYPEEFATFLKLLATAEGIFAATRTGEMGKRFINVEFGDESYSFIKEEAKRASKMLVRFFGDTCRAGPPE
ncbi:MAG: hypothetical protein MPK06_05625 [Alphaproteobacteria bacterium]|nr:hypothetical protein [Alphaproteobacteria bacterium]MDA8004220.1 hypothetical protein [Alphaproteobacteria bacterium]MDA8006000.1 hypothetical protein [Alphaproteobacteria bacterium]MDA8013373.1 hypothetical protein [Alphaproteobacteria bacterium]